MKCQAKRTNGEPCRAWAIAGKRVCRVHGGKTPSGAASPHFKTGRYSRDLPAALVGKYQQSQRDPDLLELKSEINLTDARIAELLERIDTGESQDRWELLQGLHAQLVAAAMARDTVKMSAAIKSMGEAISAGDDGAQWAVIFEAIEQRRRLVESERRRMVELSMYISAESAMLLVSALVDIVRQHVSDQKTLASISSDVEKLITIEPTG